MDSTINKKDYLKKYLSKNDKKIKKTKRKIAHSSAVKSKVIDDDLDLKNMRLLDDNEVEIYDLTEDAPQIVGIIDERPEELRNETDQNKTKKWKIMTSDYDDVQVTSINDENFAEKKSRTLSKEKPIPVDHDLSPPRRGNTKKINRNSSSDESPPRKASHKSKYNEKQTLSLKQLKRTKKKVNSSSDQSSSDFSPQRKHESRISSDSDASPPRKRHHHISNNKTNNRKKGSSKVNSDSYKSPPSKALQSDTDSDTSPPRKPKMRRTHGNHSDSDVSPIRRTRVSIPKRQRGDVDNSDSDVSSTRRGSDSDSDSSDAKIKKRSLPHKKSKLRKTIEENDATPPRRHKKYIVHSSSSSSKYKRCNLGADSTSPDHKQKLKKSSSHSKKVRSNDQDSDASPPRMNEPRHGNDRPNEKRSQTNHRESSRTLEGKKAGLQGVDELRKETAEIRRLQNAQLASLSESFSGKGAATVVRDKKTGRKKDMKEEERQKKQKEEKNAEIVAQYSVWGKGLKQVDDLAAKKKEDMYEMTKPLARYADDADLDEMLRNEEYEEDPMLDYIRNKKRKEGKDLKVMPQYQGSYMPNRYNIRPGHKWDGVDRSNGYEKKWFEERNSRKALEEEAFKWSTEDM